MYYRKVRVTTVVSVYLIDIGKMITSCRDSELLHLEDEFRSFPPQAVQIRIAHCVPCDLDPEWDGSIVDIVRRWLEEASVGSNVHIEGRIELSVINTVWLDTLRVVEQLPGIDTAVQIMSVHRNLLNKQFAIVDKKALEKLTGLALAAGIWNETPEMAVSPNVNEISADVSSHTVDEVAAEQPMVVAKIPVVSQLRGRRHRVENQTSTSVSSSSILSPVSSAITPLKSKPIHHEHSWAELDFDEFQEVYISTYYSPRLFYVQKYSEM